MPRNKGPHVQIAYDYIKAKILSFDFPPGTHISDHVLTKELAMSRSPIREAIQKLISDGLVEMKNQRAEVAQLSMEDIIEISQVLEAIEITAVNIIMDNSGLGIEYEKKLTDCYNSMANSNELYKNYYFDDQFHSIIMSAAGNERLIEIYHSMRQQIARTRWIDVVVPERNAVAAKEKEALLKALISGDREASIKCLRAHLENNSTNLKVLSSPLDSPQFHLTMASIPGSLQRSVKN